MSDELYPDDSTLRFLETWDGDPNVYLTYLEQMWVTQYGSAGNELRPYEAAVVDVEPGKCYLRLSTGGWSRNKELIAAARQNYLMWALTWEMSARGGLYIFRYTQLHEVLQTEPNETLLGAAKRVVKERDRLVNGVKQTLYALTGKSDIQDAMACLPGGMTIEELACQIREERDSYKHTLDMYRPDHGPARW